MGGINRFLIVFVLLINVSRGNAQIIPAISDEIILYRGERFMPFIDGPVEDYAESSAEFTKQQMRLVVQMRENIALASSFLKGCDLFHPPQGFKLVVRSNTFPPVEFHDNESLSGTLRFELYVTLVCNEKPCYDQKTDAWVSISFNDPGMLGHTHIMDDIWIQPRKVSDFYGQPVYRFNLSQREIVVATDGSNPVYLPVSREDFIMTLIAHFNDIIAEEERMAAMSLSKSTILSSRDSEKQYRRLEFEEAYSRLNRFDPLLARKLKNNYDETERRVREASSDSVRITLSQFLTMQVNVWKEGVRKLRAELNAMSPSERRSQAHWSEAEAMSTSGLTPPGHPGSNPVARINPAIFDHSKKDSDIQLITVEWGVDTAPYAAFRQGRSLVFNKLYHLEFCSTGWEKLFGMVKDLTE